MDFSSILSSESIMAGDLRIDPESLTYMTPERFFGQPHDHLSDQFSLGLLAMELLGGERVPGVTRPRDLEDKQRLFKDFETGHGRWALRSEAFSGLVSRLLRTNPEDRWDSMHDVAGILQDIEIAESPEERCRRIARSSYVKLQSGGRERAFFERFYNGLFASLPEIQRHFADVDMSKQHAMLNKAVQLLIDFDPARGCEELARSGGEPRTIRAQQGPLRQLPRSAPRDDRAVGREGSGRTRSVAIGDCTGARVHADLPERPRRVAAERVRHAFNLTTLPAEATGAP